MNTARRPMLESGSASGRDRVGRDECITDRLVSAVLPLRICNFPVAAAGEIDIPLGVRLALELGLARGERSAVRIVGAPGGRDRVHLDDRVRRPTTALQQRAQDLVNRRGAAGAFVGADVLIDRREHANCTPEACGGLVALCGCRHGSPSSTGAAVDPGPTDRRAPARSDGR